MTKVYSAANPTEAHLVRGYLETNGIRAVVEGDALWFARGEVPMSRDTLPAVCVNDEDYERASALIEQRDGSASRPRCENCGYDLRGLTEPRCPECGEPFTKPSFWVCPTCGERIEGQFTECWKCVGTGDELDPEAAQPDPEADELDPETD